MIKAKIGDIIEIKTKNGYVYAQYTHKNKLMGTLIRVFTGYYEERPKNFKNIVENELRFIVFFPLEAAIKQKIVDIVTNIPIPEKQKNFPIFRCGMVNPNTSKVDVWWLWDGEKEWKIGNLNDEQKKYPIRGIWNDTLLIERIENEWKPKEDSYN